MIPAVTEEQVITALRSFLIGLELTGVDPADIFEGQANRVPEPKADNFIVFTPTYRRRLATNVETWTIDAEPAELRHEKSTEVTVQLDIHGSASADNAAVIATLWRSDYACRALDPVAQPLYATDGHQAPFVNAAKQYEFRWVMSLVMQANVTLSTPMEFADTIDVTLIEADT